jgi:hypothetical protein
MGFIEWMKTDGGIKTISFIWGLGIALLFQQECKKRDCMIIQSPPIDEIQKKTFSMAGNENDCFRFEPQFVSCQSSQ